MEALPTRDNLPTISLESPEFRSWLQYFDRHLGWRPVVLRMIIAKQKTVLTVPTQWPQWFDQTFVELDEWKPAEELPPSP